MVLTNVYNDYIPRCEAEGNVSGRKDLKYLLLFLLCGLRLPLGKVILDIRRNVFASKMVQHR